MTPFEQLMAYAYDFFSKISDLDFGVRIAREGEVLTIIIGPKPTVEQAVYISPDIEIAPPEEQPPETLR